MIEQCLVEGCDADAVSLGMCKKCWGHDYYLRNKDAFKRRSTEWRDENRDKFNEIQRVWRKNNPEKKAEENRKYYLANKDSIRELKRKWWKKNPHKNREYSRTFSLSLKIREDFEALCGFKITRDK